MSLISSGENCLINYCWYEVRNSDPNVGCAGERCHPVYMLASSTNVRFM